MDTINNYFDKTNNLLLEFSTTVSHKIIGASLSEPHIDRDVGPTSRGTYLSMWPGVALVLQCSREHAYYDVIFTWCVKIILFKN